MKLKIVAIITVILLLVVMSVPVYADTTIPPMPTDRLEYWVIYHSSYYGLQILSSNGPITAEERENGIWLIANGYRHYYYEENEWKLRLEGGYIASSLETIYASNHDIAYEDGSGFFFLSPKVPRLYQTMKTQDFGTIWKTFSVGLIPIIGLIILALSLRKAWEFLQGQLTS